MRALLLSCCVALTHTMVFRASAQSDTEGFSADRFEPSERGSEWFALDSLDLRGKPRGAIGVVGDYGYKPLVFYDANDKEVSALVEHQLFLHLGASIVLADRIRLAANLPVLAMLRGDAGSLAGQTYTVSEGGGIGDLRISADLRLFGEYGGPITMALGASLWAPTGKQSAFAGDGKLRISPHLLLAGELGAFAYAARAGFSYRGENGTLAGTRLGSEVVWGVSAGLRLAKKRLLIGPEVYGSTIIEGSVKKSSTPIEGVFGAHYTIADHWRLGAGVGPGFTRGLGSPQLRGLMSLEWVSAPPAPPPEPPSDRDGDGIFDEDDACPDEAGPRSSDPAKNGCPIRDRDGDGIVDDDDACPDDAGPRSSDPKKNGCPDRDGDGVLDTLDAGPDDPGPETDDPTTTGCPDRDNDGIIDRDDACPFAAGPPNDDPEKNGCPEARIEKGQIRILNQVQFKLNSAAILPTSEPVLNAVLAILEEHPEITRVSVEGHTDNQGSAKYNKKLSQRRAASVAEWLTGHGIDESRLSSAGFGLELPLVSNDTEEGRAKNRRVEFHIREVDGKPADDAGERVSE